MESIAVATPYYVLLDGKLRVGPTILSILPDRNYTAIFAFSDEQPYKIFCENSNVALTPYPLVKGYLRNQMMESVDSELLIVVDASGPNGSQLNAATASSVLEAQENRSKQVPISFELHFDREAQAYRATKISLEACSRAESAN